MTKNAKIAVGIGSFALLVAVMSGDSGTAPEQAAISPVVQETSTVLEQNEISVEQDRKEIVGNVVEQASDTITEPEPEPEPEPEIVSASVTTGLWYVSSHYSSQYYYHESCDGWQDLSPRFLKSFSSETALEKSVSGRTLHYDCKPQ